MLEPSEVNFVKRIVVGSTSPTELKSEQRIEEAVNLLNRCLSGTPRGRILGIEQSCIAFRHQQRDITLVWTTYQVGFARKPYWLTDP
jgi:hypothetical protein